MMVLISDNHTPPLVLDSQPGLSFSIRQLAIPSYSVSQISPCSVCEPDCSFSIRCQNGAFLLKVFRMLLWVLFIRLGREHFLPKSCVHHCTTQYFQVTPFTKILDMPLVLAFSLVGTHTRPTSLRWVEAV